MTILIEVKYNQTGQSKKINHLGMREMQQMVYEKKDANIENGTNKLLGWYDKEIHLEIPTPNIEVTDEVWQEALNTNANCYENGEFIVKDFTTDVEIEDIRIQQIEAKCNRAIEAVYPIYKQINITNLLTPYAEEDREIMKSFIDSKRAICHKAIKDGIKAEDVTWEVING